MWWLTRWTCGICCLDVSFIDKTFSPSDLEQPDKRLEKLTEIPKANPAMG